MSSNGAIAGVSQSARRPFARLFRSASERAMVWLIHICGWSAVVLVLAIFFFVFREAAPMITKISGAPVGVNLLNGGMILSLISVPIIVSIGEDALKAVPDSYREAAVSLGAGRWEIVYRVLFPAAKNGLLAAVLLGVGRAIGETMAVTGCCL